MKIISSIQKIQSFTNNFKKKGKTIGFVPTMGYLHEGHASLIRQAKKENDLVIVSIYVNPAQFDPKEDFSKYPRDLKQDLKILKKEKVDILFLPTDEELYGKKLATRNSKLETRHSTFSLIPPSYLTNCLCGQSRPGHFAGVALIVAKLFNIIKPHLAYFGQKDFQQTLVIKKLVKDLNFDTKIIVCPTIREKDGLAMSSRNVYLNQKERQAALVLSKTLNAAKKMIIDRRDVAVQRLYVTEIENHYRQLINQEPLVKIEYFEIRDAEDLSEIKKIKKNQKIIIAGAIKIGKTRLIDNLLINNKN